MKKTLIVTYTPRKERSNTKKLVDMFVHHAKGTEIEVLDLLKDIPDVFLEENLTAYIKRNYMGQELTPGEQKAISKMDRMAQQFKSADYVVVAYPMYNFSMPAIVKAYFDSIMLKGETWDRGENGILGKMKGKKALTLSSSAGTYSEANGNLGWDHSTTLSKVEFQFMGFDDIHLVSAEGVSTASEEQRAKILKEADAKIQEITRSWYGSN